MESSVASLLRHLRAQLRTEEAAVEAERIACTVLGQTPAWLLAHRDSPVTEADWQACERLVQRRTAGEPLAYLLGRRGFWMLNLKVTHDTLIPRPETERLVELALDRLSDLPGLRVLDLGTGTGAIALAIAAERPHADVTAVDASTAALEVARENANDHGLQRVRFVAGSWFVPLAGEAYDVIVSNPPYIAEDDTHLLQGDLRFEPRSALVSGRDGLDAIREICARAPAQLTPGGWLLVEHGWQQGQAVRELFARAGFQAIETARDLEDRERVTLGQLPPASERFSY